MSGKSGRKIIFNAWPPYCCDENARFDFSVSHGNVGIHGALVENQTRRQHAVSVVCGELELPAEAPSGEGVEAEKTREGGRVGPQGQ